MLRLSYRLLELKQPESKPRLRLNCRPPRPKQLRNKHELKPNSKLPKLRPSRRLNVLGLLRMKQPSSSRRNGARPRDWQHSTRPSMRRR